MNTKIRDSFEKVLSDKTLIKRIYSISLAFAILLLLMIVKDISSSRTYIADSKGNIIGIERRSKDKTEVFRMNLTICKESGDETRLIEITKSRKEKKSETDADDKEALIDAEISGIVSELELSEDRRLNLPLSLSDGTRLKWSCAEDNEKGFIILSVTYLSLIAALIIDKLKAPLSEGEQIRKEILKGLPRFVNQLLLMMNSGMILSDSLQTICTSYRIIPEDERGYFERKLIEINDIHEKSKISAAGRINVLAAETKVKELMRVAAILYENEKRGCSIIDNLSRESSYLWEDRKIVAKERGKIIDTKMSYPLGILLILLIVITMAPAMLTM